VWFLVCLDVHVSRPAKWGREHCQFARSLAGCLEIFNFAGCSVQVEPTTPVVVTQGIVRFNGGLLDNQLGQYNYVHTNLLFNCTMKHALYFSVHNVYLTCSSWEINLKQFHLASEETFITKSVNNLPAPLFNSVMVCP
jgi:hypothetical protein